MFSPKTNHSLAGFRKHVWLWKKKTYVGKLVEKYKNISSSEMLRDWFKGNKTSKMFGEIEIHRKRIISRLDYAEYALKNEWNSLLIPSTNIVCQLSYTVSNGEICVSKNPLPLQETIAQKRTGHRNVSTPSKSSTTVLDANTYFFFLLNTACVCVARICKSIFQKISIHSMPSSTLWNKTTKEQAKFFIDFRSFIPGTSLNATEAW